MMAPRLVMAMVGSSNSSSRQGAEEERPEAVAHLEVMRLEWANQLQKDVRRFYPFVGVVASQDRGDDLGREPHLVVGARRLCDTLSVFEESGDALIRDGLPQLVQLLVPRHQQLVEEEPPPSLPPCGGDLGQLREDPGDRRSCGAGTNEVRRSPCDFALRALLAHASLARVSAPPVAEDAISRENTAAASACMPGSTHP